MSVRGSQILHASVICLIASAAFLNSPVQAQTLNAKTGRSGKLLPLGAFGLPGTVTLGDFDGDRQADVAVLEPQGVVDGAYRYRISVHLSGEPSTDFLVEARTSGPGLHISAQDIDGDHDIDLVITSQFGQEPVGVWINDGHGRFTQGDANAYPKFIWEQNGHFLEPPGNEPCHTLEFTAPGLRWAAQQSFLPLPLPSTTVRTQRPVYPPALTATNPGNPLRAPPI